MSDVDFHDPKSSAGDGREDGFSMTELMVALVIIGILALMALPRFMDVATQAKMSEAKLMLRQLHALEQSFYFEHDRYTARLDSLRFEQPPLVTAGGQARYVVAVDSVGAFSFVATATSVVDYDKDGVFNVWRVRQDGSITEQTPD